MSTGDPATPEPVKKLFVALADLRTPPVPEKIRRDAGHYLNELQDGESLSLPISRPMPSIGARVHELRLSEPSGDWRVIYRVDGDAILVVDVFPKKTVRTPPGIIKRCQARLTRYDAEQADPS